MKRVLMFSEGNKEMHQLLGGKGAGLAEMTKLGLPVPKGFTITTAAYLAFEKNGNKIAQNLMQEIINTLSNMEKEVNKSFGNIKAPLLISVRSGAPVSMPGMMDTVLNIGLNDQTVEALGKLTNDERFAYDSYRRLLQMFGNVVYGIPEKKFERVLCDIKKIKNYNTDLSLTVDDLKMVIEKFKQIYLLERKRTFPQDPQEQLSAAINAVFLSWNNKRAKIYRKKNGISDKLGTAVNVQEMVFGNAGEFSGTGVIFSRSPSTGARGMYGEYLANAQGEDIVAGGRTPVALERLKRSMPKVYAKLAAMSNKLEQHYHDMQDIEFTIERGEIYLLQARAGKRTSAAAIKIAVDLVNEGIIEKEEGLLRVSPETLEQMLHPDFDQKELQKEVVLATGRPASPGAASGRVYFTAAAAKKAYEKGQEVILVRQNTAADDIEGMVVSEGLVTARGGMTSHAAVVARGLGIVAVVGVNELEIDEQKKIIRINQTVLREGEWLSADGTTGKLYVGKVRTVRATVNKEFSQFLRWAKTAAKVEIYANADTTTDLKAALNFGAEGIGLVRTEHMFFKAQRLHQLRALILAQNAKERDVPLQRLAEMQQEDFYKLYKVAKGKTVTIRLLDAPLHEFLPTTEPEIALIAAQNGRSKGYIQARIAELKETNPMMGHRGCRLAVSFPEIYEMQVEAIILAALKANAEGVRTVPHIMLPLVSLAQEMDWMRDLLDKKVNKLFEKNNVILNYKIGTMIETPRACLIADQIADKADFFSFGTNDLTQLTFGYSRDDIGAFVPEYLNKKILPDDPFQVLDTEGVGRLIKLAIAQGRKNNTALPIGVCGEVGGDPRATAFFERNNITYLSCSPYRVPLVLLRMAQEHLDKRKRDNSIDTQIKK
ncbi:pyruvate, phosphate dikinase [Liquorilactobacillus aquaticus]|nr:pyruvate, phosphate dikinase [Liquorilactobacillus aquaticus]